MFLPKVLLEFIFIGQVITSGAYSKEALLKIKDNYNSSESQEKQIREKSKDKNCAQLCSRPMSDSETCEKFGNSSIGCINYKRCFDKCEETIKLQKETNKNFLQNTI